MTPEALDDAVKRMRAGGVDLSYDDCLAFLKAALAQFERADGPVQRELALQKVQAAADAALKAP